MYIDRNDTLYICDTDNNRIQKWIQGATSGTTVAGTVGNTAGSTAILLQKPRDLNFDDNGFMYVIDYENHRVQRFPPNSSAGTSGTTVAGTGSPSGSLNALKHPTSIDIDDDFNLYILDAENKRVVQWAPNAAVGTLLITDNDLNNAQDILLATNSSNQVYISYTSKNLINSWMFNTSSSTLFLSLSQVNGSQSTLNSPNGIILDPYGNLYVANSQNDPVVMYCQNFTVGTVVADDTTLSINQPIDVAFDSNLNLYLLDQNNGRVIKYTRW